MRLPFLLCFVALCGCAAVFGGKAKTTASQKAEPEDEDAGVDSISGLLRDLRAATEKKRFDEAKELLRRAEKAVKSASDITRGHPDFEDTAAMVKRARPQLEAAIERDRIARRNAAIDDLIRRGNQLLQRAHVILSELQSRVPEATDIQNINEVAEAMAAIEKEGNGFVDEPRYMQHAQARDQQTNALLVRRRIGEWQLAASKALQPPIKTAFAAAGAYKTARTGSDQVEQLKRASEGFASCVNTMADLEARTGYDGSYVVETKLGTLPAQETKKLCLENGAKVREQLDKLTWQRRIAAVVQKVNSTVGALRAAKDATSMLNVSQAAVEALADCNAELDKADTLPGYDSKLGFDSIFGNLAVSKLQRACADERAKISRSQSTWQWQRSYEAKLPTLNALQKAERDASSVEDSGARVEAWRKVVEGFGDCARDAKMLARDRHADKSFSLTTPFGELTAANLEGECKRQRGVAQGKLDEAIAVQKLERFVSTCRGDEVAVARREGIPSQVMPVDGGRVFVYEQRGKPSQSFGFDEKGMRVDFSARWREKVTSVADEVSRVLTTVSGGKDGKTILKAVHDAMPVLEVCQEALAHTEKNPGFDKTRKFTSPLGNLTATELRSACGKERGRLTARVPGLKWRVRFEEVGSRAQDAMEQLDKAKSASTAKSRVKMVSGALGGLKECSERAEVLPREAGADRRLAINSPFGQVTASGLQKACKKQVGAASQALDDALAAQKLEDFINNCKGDEAEVARREGMPTRVENKKGGRIFVYEPPKKKRGEKKRFAFDKSGKRVEERTLH